MKLLHCAVLTGLCMFAFSYCYDEGPPLTFDQKAEYDAWISVFGYRSILYGRKHRRIMKSPEFKRYQEIFLARKNAHDKVAVINTLSIPIRLQYYCMKDTRSSGRASLRRRIIQPGKTQKLSYLIARGLRWSAIKECPDTCTKDGEHRHYGSSETIYSEDLESKKVTIKPSPLVKGALKNSCSEHALDLFYATVLLQSKLV